MVINEVAWAGTAANAADEWIELYNTGDSAVDLGGWQLIGIDGAPVIALSGTIGPGAYFLIERTDDDTVSDIPADLAVPFGKSGSLENAGERLELRDGGGIPVDAVDCPSAWFAGSASPDYLSMERIDPLGDGSEPANWASNDGSITTGLDAAGQPIRGTPKYRNSVQ